MTDKTEPTKLYVVEGSELDTLARVAKRLYTEERLDGDAMRNLAQCVDVIVRRVREMELSERDAAYLLGLDVRP